HTATMDRIVFPAMGAVIACHVSAGTEMMVMMMVHHDYMAAVPVKGTEIDAGTDINPGTPDKRGGAVVIAPVRPVDGRIGVPPPGTIHHSGVIIGNVNHFPHPGFNNDMVVVTGHFDVLHIFQAALLVGALAKLLNGV